MSGISLPNSANGQNSFFAIRVAQATQATIVALEIENDRIIRVFSCLGTARVHRTGSTDDRVSHRPTGQGSRGAAQEEQTAIRDALPGLKILRNVVWEDSQERN